MKNERTLAKFTHTATGRVWEVQQWDSYGIVLPNYGTTNGSIPTVLRMLPFWTSQGLSPEYTWESLHPLIPSDISDPMALFDGLYAAYMEGFVENYEGARASKDKTFARVRENLRTHFRGFLGMELNPP